MSADLFVVLADRFIFLLDHLRSLLDGGGVHALLPHTVRVCQEDVIRRLPEPALGEQLAAADAHREPGTLQEDLGGSSTGLHHSPETSGTTGGKQSVQLQIPRCISETTNHKPEQKTKLLSICSVAQIILFPAATAAETHGYCSP